MSADDGRSDSSAGQQDRLEAAVLQGCLDEVKGIFARTSHPIVADMDALIHVAASIGKKDILDFLLDQKATRVHANDHTPLMPDMLLQGKVESPLRIVAKHGLGDIAVMLLDRFEAKQQDLIAALEWLTRHHKNDAVRAIIAQLFGVGEEPMCKKPRHGALEDMSSSLAIGLLVSLHVAVAGGHANAVKQLVDASERLVGGSLDHSSALHLACKHGHVQVMKVLLHHQRSAARMSAATVDAMVLAAAAAGHADTACLALSARPQPHALRDLLVHLTEERHTDAVFCILKELQASSDLASSSGDGGGGEAGDIGADGAAADATKYALAVALAEAAGQGRDGVVHLLLGAKADVNAMQGLPLRRAVACGCDVTIKLLLGASACVHVLKDEPLRAAARARHASAVLMLVAEGADAKVLTNDMVADGAARGEMEWVLLLLRLNDALDKQAALSCVCKEAVKGGSSCRTGLIQEVKDCMAKSCNRAEARVQELTHPQNIHPGNQADAGMGMLHEVMGHVNAPLPDHGTEQAEHRIVVSRRARLALMFAALRRELRVADEQGARPTGSFSAAIAQGVDAALRLANDMPRASHLHHAGAIRQLLNDGVRAALSVAFRGEDFESDQDLAKARDYLFPPSEGLGKHLLSEGAALLHKKKEAFTTAFAIINNGAIPLEENVNDLVCAASQLASPNEHLPHISMLFDVFGAGVNFAIHAGLRRDVLLRCVLNRVLLEGTGVIGAWAWHYLRQRRRFRNLLAMYEEVTMRVGNQGYAQAKRNFHYLASALEQQQHSA